MGCVCVCSDCTTDEKVHSLTGQKKVNSNLKLTVENSLTPKIRSNHHHLATAIGPVVWFSCSVVSDSLQPHRTMAHQAPLLMRFPRQEYWSG